MFRIQFGNIYHLTLIQGKKWVSLRFFLSDGLKIKCPHEKHNLPYLFRKSVSATHIWHFIVESLIQPHKVYLLYWSDIEYNIILCLVFNSTQKCNTGFEVLENNKVPYIRILKGKSSKITTNFRSFIDTFIWILEYIANCDRIRFTFSFVTYNSCFRILVIQWSMLIMRTIWL